MRATHEQRGHGPLEVMATLGPASWDLAEAMVEAGAAALRINASHVSPGGLGPALRKVRGELPLVPLVVDLQGAKMRLGDFEERYVEAGQTVGLSPPGGGEQARCPASTHEIPLSHPEIFLAVSKGETLTIDDGRIILRVEKTEPSRIQARSLGEGLLRPRKGINVVEHPVDPGDLSEIDSRFVEEAREIAEVSFAYSFMRDGREADWMRERAPGARVAGKIERAEAVAALDTIAGRVDSIWICRGDLGEQLGLASLARFVGELEPSALPLPVWMAGQVLEHLTCHREPTRSEVCHLYDMARRGYAGIVLSDETAVGADPVGAVRAAAKLAAELHELRSQGGPF